MRSAGGPSTVVTWEGDVALQRGLTQRSAIRSGQGVIAFI